jgi:hypothetical protein
MKIIDPGHKYELLCLDGKLKQTLQFVKRFDRHHPENYPGNFNAHPGTTLQDVIRCLLNRVRYLQNQIPCPENEILLGNLQQCLWVLENRALRRHGLGSLELSLEQVEMKQLCKECGHIVCEHSFA